MTKPLPEDLVRALVNDAHSETGEIHAGELPPDFPPSLIPAQSKRVIGGTGGPRGISGVFALPEDADALDIADDLEKRGYRQHALHQEGFQMNTVRTLEKDRMFVSIVALPPAAGERIVKLFVSELLEPAERRPRFHEPLFPSLRPPPGSTSRGGGTRGGGNARHAHHELETGLAPRAVLEHYAAELRAAGWSTLEQNTSDDHELQWLAFDDADGSHWTGTLSATRSGNTVSVFINMTSPKNPERDRRDFERIQAHFAEHEASSPPSASATTSTALKPVPSRRPGKG
jgi:hypothetical protein